MNKNTKLLRGVARKEFKKSGETHHRFTVPVSKAGSALDSKTVTITMGYMKPKRKTAWQKRQEGATLMDATNQCHPAEAVAQAPKLISQP